MRKTGLLALATLVTVCGCVELGLLPGAGSSSGSTPPTDGGGGGNGNTSDVLRVRLTVSNTNPTITEEVLFRCTIVEGNSAGVVFAYQPNSGRLNVNRDSGTASFIVDQSDLGTAFRFTCTAESPTASSEPSNQVLIIPSG